MIIKLYKKLKNSSHPWDKVQHFFLAVFLIFITSLFFSFDFSLGFTIGSLLFIELTQIDIFGIKGRVKDTLLDLLADFLGLLFGVYVFCPIIGMILIYFAL